MRIAMSTNASQVLIQITTHQRHESMHRSCGNSHLQGVWGRATPPAGSARGSARSHAPQRNLPFDGATCAGWRQVPYAGSGTGGSPLSIR